MNLSIFFDHILEASEQSKKSISEILEIAKQSGFCALECNFSLLEKNPEFIKIIQEKKFLFSCLWEFYDWETSNDFSKAEKHIYLAKKLDAKKILIVPGFLKQKKDIFLNLNQTETEAKMNSISEIQNIVKMLNKTVNFSEKQNITVTIEDFDAINSPCEHINQLLYLFKKVPGLKFTFDTGNFCFSDENVIFAFDTLFDYIEHVHCKDRGIQNEADFQNKKYCLGLKSVPVGSGYLKNQIEKIVKTLNQKNYEGFFATEHFNAENQEEAIKKSAKFLLDCK